MNNGRIWCVVNPTVGLPLFLGSVAAIAITVHFAVLSNTSWFSNYWNGSAAAKVGLKATTSPAVAQTSAGGPEFVIDVRPTAGSADGAASFVVTVSPKDAPGNRVEKVVTSGKSEPGGMSVASTDAR